MEVAPADVNPGQNYTWGCYDPTFFSVPAAQGISVGTGATNTAAIVANCTEPYAAAKMAMSYTLNGFHDWYLPSKDELNLLYTYYSVAFNLRSTFYVSSTEYVSADVGVGYAAYCQTILPFPPWPAGFTQFCPKHHFLPVRAIRTF